MFPCPEAVSTGSSVHGFVGGVCRVCEFCPLCASSWQLNNSVKGEMLSSTVWKVLCGNDEEKQAFTNAVGTLKKSIDSTVDVQRVSPTMGLWRVFLWKECHKEDGLEFLLGSLCLGFREISRSLKLHRPGFQLTNEL